MVRNFNVAALLILFVLGMVFYFLLISHAPEVKAGSEHNLTGWAWSENVGWISFNSTNQSGGANYGVTMDSGGNVSGYAWSEHVGWISFNESTGCPQSPCQPKLNRATGEIFGWAKALAASGGWDGWIHLKGSNYGVTVSACAWDGWAWGSDVLGWIHFKGSNYGVLGLGAGCGAQPDLIVSSGPLLNSGVLAGGSTVSFKGTISNQGDAQAFGTFSNRFQIDINNDGSINTTLAPNPTLSGLVAGGFSEVVSGNWSNIPVGTHKIILCADQPPPAGGSITESNENNNCAESVMTVSVPEFYLASSNDLNVNVTGAGASPSNNTKITVTPIGAFTDDVALSAQSVSPALPTGTVYNFSPRSLKQNQYSSGSNFKVTVLGEALEGDYIITVQGQSSGLTRTVNVILHVNLKKPIFREI